MSVKEDRMSDADDVVYSTHTIKIEPMSPQREDQYSCSLIKVEKDCEDDTDAVDTHDRFKYIIELEEKKEEPCETPKEEQGTVSNAEHDGPHSVHNTDVPVKVEIEIGPTVIQPQYIGSSLHTTDASKGELIQCGGADVALATTTPGAASYCGHTTGTTDQIKKSKKNLNCNICQYKCKDKSMMIRHMSLHTGDKPFSCNICEYKCAVKSYLVQHIKRLHAREKPFSCNICNYKGALKSFLTKHMRMHSEDKPFSCNICEYKCKQKSSLVAHIMRMHSRDKPFSCNTCEYKCVIKSHLARHMRIHTRYKPFSCNTCEYKCAIKSNLVTHMRIHTGDTQFSCNICEYKCVSKSLLVKHMHMHSENKPFSCNICEYKCSFKANLVRHMRTHPGVMVSCNM